MRKAMSKKVGAGGRFDIFLDSGMESVAQRTNFPIYTKIAWLLFRS